MAEDVKELDDESSARHRLNVSSSAESILRGPLLGDFLTAYPRIRLELDVTEHTGDIVETGYDGAVGHGEVIEQDMIAVRSRSRSSSPYRWEFAENGKDFLGERRGPRRDDRCRPHRPLGHRRRPLTTADAGEADLVAGLAGQNAEGATSSGFCRFRAGRSG